MLLMRYVMAFTFYIIHWKSRVITLVWLVTLMLPPGYSNKHQMADKKGIQFGMPEASTVLLLSKHTNSPCLNTPELHFTLHFFSESEREREIVRGNISKHTLPDAHMLNPVSLQTTHMDMILQCSFSTFQTQRHTYLKKNNNPPSFSLRPPGWETNQEFFLWLSSSPC